MKKILISSLIGAGVVAGGIILYTASREVKDNSILTIQGTNMEGLFQEITFSGQGCSYSDETGRTVAGETTTEDVETTCGIGLSSGVTAEQFSCAMSLCQGEIGTPGELKLCGSPTVTFTSAGGGSCTVDGGCTATIQGVETDITGSYEMSATEYQNLQSGCSGSGSSYDTCMAYGCAGVSMTNGQWTNSGQPEKEDVPGNQGNSFGTPTQTPTSR